MERVIKCNLRQAQRFLDKSRPSYNDKLCLVDSFDVLDEKTMGAVKNLNVIRNRLAHCGTTSISVEDIDKIGNNFGKEYRELRTEWLKDTKELMCCVFELILFGLFPKIYHLEHDTRSQ